LRGGGKGGGEPPPPSPSHEGRGNFKELFSITKGKIMTSTITSCRICRDREEPLESLTKALNAAKDSQDKIRRAEAIIKEVDGLLEDPGHDQSTRCQAFRQTASLKKQIAEMAVKLHSSLGKKTTG